MKRRAIVAAMSVWLMSLGSAWADSELSEGRLVKLFDQEMGCSEQNETYAACEPMLNGPTFEYTEHQIQ